MCWFFKKLSNFSECLNHFTFPPSNLLFKIHVMLLRVVHLVDVALINSSSLFIAANTSQCDEARWGATSELQMCLELLMDMHFQGYKL